MYINKIRLPVFCLSILFLINYSYASTHCTEQKKFDTFISYDGKIINVNIERKDKQNFVYYTLPIQGRDLFLGVIFEKNNLFNLTEIPVIQILSPPPINGERKYIYNIHNTFNINDSHYLSSYLLHNKTSQVYKLPIKNPTVVKSYKAKVDLNDFMSNFKEIYQYKNMNGTYKIKFYVTFLHDQETGICSYFETKYFPYNLNNAINYVEKPLEFINNKVPGPALIID